MHVEGGSGSQMFTVNVDGSGLSDLTPSGAWDAEPSWSPDGARLAFVSTRDNPSGTYQYDVFVADVDGSNVKRLTSIGAGAPAWSPDGRQIIFSSGARLYVMNADGSSLARLTQPPPNSWDSAPVWMR
jgi:Tol biopolymer transport system component